MSRHHAVEISTPNNNFEHQTEQVVAEFRPLWKDAALEAVGTAFFVYISLAGVHQAVLSALSTNSSVDEIHIAICFTLGLTSGIVVALRSGAHLNSSVSFTLWAAGKLPFKKFIVYMLSQLTGGFFGALLVIALYYSRINEFAESGALIGSFGTLKNPANSLVASILDQFIGSALLMFGILKAPDSKWKPLVIGLVLGGLGLFQGSNGFAFNLARDLAPRIASTIIYGSDPFTAADHWFWVPMVMPFFGMPLGYLAAQLL